MRKVLYFIVGMIIFPIRCIVGAINYIIDEGYDAVTIFKIKHRNR